MIEKRQFYIDGTWVDPVVSNDHVVINPATEEACAIVSMGGQGDTDAAVAAAKAAFPDWMATPLSKRIELVENLLAIYTRRSDELGAAISLEIGAPIDLAQSNHIRGGARHMTHYLNAARNLEMLRPLGDHAPNDQIAKEPIGVCALITPWNWPLNQITLKVVAAAIAGCTMVLKPSEESPLNALLYAEMMDEAGFPKGVFNLVNGDGPGVGTQLSTHKDVDMVSLTGSPRAGKAISQAAAMTLKRVHLELGGKGANIVFADADAQAVERGVLDLMQNSGQSCNAPSRMLVQRDIYDAAVAKAVEVAQNIKVDHPSKSGDHLGPVVNANQWHKIQDLIAIGEKTDGARLVAGGLGRPEGLNKGFYIRPTVFADVRNDMTIAQQEIFGPVLAMLPFDTEEDAIQMANDTRYGLTNYVQTQDLTRAKRVAQAMRSGMVEINGHSRGGGAPFGGMKQSGNGREGGFWGIDDFLETKSIAGWISDA
ncbi:MAG: aldehyde dehydrogenase family protein [Thalassovita sp.]